MTTRRRALDGAALLPLLLLGGSAACNDGSAVIRRFGVFFRGGGEGGEGGALDAWCNTPGSEVTLLLYAMVLGLIAAVVVAFIRRHSLARWDLRESPRAPSLSLMAWILAMFFPSGFLVSGLVLSVVLHTAAGCAPEQRFTNVMYTWMGVGLAALLCLAGLLAVNWWWRWRQ